MILKIGSLDITPFIAHKGVKWQRSDLDSPNATRTMDGTLHRQRIATKVRLDITCRPLKLTEACSVLTAIQPETVQVTYTDPMAGMTVVKTMYSNNNPASYAIKDANNVEWWDGISFPLIEV